MTNNLQVSLHGETERGGLTRPVRHHARIQAIVLVQKILRLESRERDAHLQIQLLPRVHGERLVSVRFAERPHGALDALSRHRAKLGAQNPRRRRPGFGRSRFQPPRARLHHLEAYILPLPVAIEKQHEIIAPSRLAFQMPHHSPVRALHHVRREQLPRFAPLPRLIPRRKLHARDVPSRRRHPPLRASVPRPARERPRPLSRRRELVHLRRQPSPRDDAAIASIASAREYPRDRARQRRFLRDAQDSRRHPAFGASAPRLRVVSRRRRARRARRRHRRVAARMASRARRRASSCAVAVGRVESWRPHTRVSRVDRDASARAASDAAARRAPRQTPPRVARRGRATNDRARWRGCR